jgi:hypothetical protein
MACLHAITASLYSQYQTDNMGSTDYKFEGWMGLGPEAGEGKMVWQEFQPKEWEETDVDIKVTHCGICGSDLHTLRSGWVSQHLSSIFQVTEY